MGVSIRYITAGMYVYWDDISTKGWDITRITKLDDLPSMGVSIRYITALWMFIVDITN